LPHNGGAHSNEKARRLITGGLLYQRLIKGSQYIRGNP
jgi:hypothetical protein